MNLNSVKYNYLGADSITRARINLQKLLLTCAELTDLASTELVATYSVYNGSWVSRRLRVCFPHTTELQIDLETIKSVYIFVIQKDQVLRGTGNSKKIKLQGLIT